MFIFCASLRIMVQYVESEHKKLLLLKPLCKPLNHTEEMVSTQFENDSPFLILSSYLVSSEKFNLASQEKHANQNPQIQGLPRTTNFLELVLTALPEWVAALQPFPAVTWPAFIGGSFPCPFPCPCPHLC